MILFTNRIRYVLLSCDKKLLSASNIYNKYLNTSFNFYKNTREKFKPNSSNNKKYKGIKMADEPINKSPVQLKRIKYRNSYDRALVPLPSIDIQIIGCGAKGSPRSVCISTTTTKFVFTLIILILAYSINNL